MNTGVGSHSGLEGNHDMEELLLLGIIVGRHGKWRRVEGGEGDI